MRSCKSAATACNCSLVSVVLPRSGFFSVMAYSVKRSMRLTAKPQLWAISLALEAQGDTVPRRGATMIWTVLATLATAAAGSP